MSRPAVARRRFSGRATASRQTASGWPGRSDRPEPGSPRHVLDAWQVEDRAPILDHVYFHTEPMKEARPGERLDFTTVIPDRRVEQLRAKVRVDPGKKAEFAQRLRATRAARVSPRALTPPPRYDGVFFEGLQQAEGKERTPPGEVELDAAAEKHLREPRA